MNKRKKKQKGPIFIEEPYTCNDCGRKNLKYEEIVFKEDENGQIDLSSVTCKTCGLMSIWPTFRKHIKPGHEKDAEKVFRKMAKGFEYNYNRRLVRRVLEKKEGIGHE
jgi:hypothetical protein